MNGAHDELVRSEPNMVTLDYLMCRTDKRTVIKTQKQAVSPFKETACFFVRRENRKGRFCNFSECFPDNSSSVFRQNNEKSRNHCGFRTFDHGARYRTRIDPTPYQPVLSGIEKYRE